MVQTVIETKKLTFEYEKDSKKILKNIDIEIEKGKFTALLGRNGSGKSTLAKHFNAILLPSGGKVYVEKMDTADERNLYDVREKVGMVFQNPDNQMVATSVEEDVAFGLENLGIEREEMRRRVEKALREVGLWEKRKSAPHLLSGGQKQRAAIAGIIAMEPDTIVFDEPTAMLDPAGRREVMETIKRLKNENGITVVLITHYMDEAARADRVVVMDKGEIALDGSPGEIFSDVEKMTGLGLDVPQVTLLCHKLREKGFDIRGDILRTQECAEAIDNILKNL